MRNAAVFPRSLSDGRAFDIAQAMLDGFNRHYRLFRETTREAQARFEAADWHGQQRAQRERIEHLPEAEQEDILCDMNVIEQVGNVALSTVLQDAWARGQRVAVHGWVYGLRDGLLKNLEVTMDRPETVVAVFSAALKRYPRVATGVDED